MYMRPARTHYRIDGAFTVSTHCQLYSYMKLEARNADGSLVTEATRCPWCYKKVVECPCLWCHSAVNE